MRNAFGAIALAALAGLVAVPSAGAVDASLKKSLGKLDPQTRFVQVCDLAAMDKLAKDKRRFRPEHAMIDYLARPKQTGDTLEGKGAVFRSGGDWYHFSFRCTTSDDRFAVLSFRYEVGAKISRDKWDELGLFP